ncbi:MAG: hypothetical protein AB8B51_19170 [Sedimentitalea sp.]
MNPFSALIDVSQLTANQGFIVEGINPNFANGSQSGNAVSSAGDINGDGIDDIIIGAKGAASLSGTNQQLFEAGEVYVVFGSTLGFPLNFDPATLNGTNGFRIVGGREGLGLGQSVSSAGDINNDGFDDLLIGSSAEGLGQNAEPGEAFVIFGSNSGFDPVTSIYDFTLGEAFQINDPNPSIPGQLGRSVSDIGDFNGDGFDDIAIGEAKAGNPFTASTEDGAVHIVFGGPTAGFPLAATPSGFANSVTYYGPLVDAGLGSSVSGIGDFNGDGLDDLIAVAPGSPFRTPTEIFATVIYGTDTIPANGNFGFDLTQLPQNGSAGFVVRNLFDPGANAANAGDVNGDGLDDFIIGGPNALQGRGLAYVVYGDANAPFNLDPSALNGTNGFIIQGSQAGGFFGTSVHAAGDVNADGFDDVIIGASGANQGGAAYVVFGGTTGGQALLNVSTLNGTNGFAIQGLSPSSPTANDGLGASVTGGVDINGDGIDDILIGAPGATSAPGGVSDVMAGRTYVIYGKDTDAMPGGVTLDGTNAANNLRGTTFDDTINGRGGNDTINGLAGNDVLLGQGGADTILGAGGNDTIDGGAGADNLRGGGGADEILGGDAGDQIFGGGGADDINGNAGNDLINGGNSNDTLTGGSGRDTINGGNGIDTVAGGAGNDVLTGGAGNDQLSGGANADTLRGNAGNDTLNGGTGRDVLNGDGGNDVLIGGIGADTLTGSFGADQFRFSQGHSGPNTGQFDTITDFSRAQNDRINLASIDGDPTTNGNQALVWIGQNSAFSDAGQVRFQTATNMLEINLDPDGAVEMRIEIQGFTNIGATDLIL